ncbi:hypothetical protein V7S43_017676 [Phytophthora oleae]|uniref:Uncharacterized protein n=1 Tax=Phytophthora oleae TaxID=2107226 RepID=A0ABD3ESS4_9STRA
MSVLHFMPSLPLFPDKSRPPQISIPVMSQCVSSVVRSPPVPPDLAPPVASKPAMVMPWDFVLQVARGERNLDHVAVVLKASLFTNIVIVISMTSIAIASHSLALLSALVENMVDLFV